VLFLGREVDYAVAVEGSLKLKEVSYIFSDAYPAGELKHGTLALIDENTLCIVIICVKELAEKSLNAVEEILSRHGKVVVVTSYGFVAKEVSGRVDEVFLLPKVSERVAPFVCATALQYIAYFCATERGLNPDKPRNLAKSVTVE
jgi:glucosamine--fructose-6-phosphate aminotransferase (isomerizing)